MLVYGNACELPDVDIAVPLYSGQYLFASNAIDNCDWYFLVKSLNVPVENATMVVTVMRK